MEKKSNIMLLNHHSSLASGCIEILKEFPVKIVEKSEDDILSLMNQNDGDLLLIIKNKVDDSFFNFIEAIKEINEHIPIVLMMDDISVFETVRVMKSGVSDIFLSIQDKSELLNKIQNYLDDYQLKKQYFNLHTPLQIQAFHGMVGSSKTMRTLYQMLEKISASKSTVLILGESGVGKELVAQAIHLLSKQSHTKFVDLNCAAIPRELLENELFGHERGAYTGAERRYIGSFERAANGTLFLDEICEMDVSLQVKMLRVLQEKHFYRVGGNEKIEVSARIVAATNRDIEKEVKEGRFREDLYYRLNVIPVYVPALRERSEDIPMLVQHFLNFYANQCEKIAMEVHPDAMNILKNYSWPGNVRELENTVQRLVALVQESQIKRKHLPEHILQQIDLKPQLDNIMINRSNDLQVASLEDLEKQAIATTLQQLSGNMAMTAKCLKIGQATLYRKIKKYGLSKAE